jgi:eukaryotic-like serine/threonine-protein kinase
MQIDDIKAVIQPALEQDFDSLYAEFQTESPGAAPSDFVAHLAAHGLIPPEVAAAAAAPAPAVAPEPAPSAPDGAASPPAAVEGDEKVPAPSFGGTGELTPRSKERQKFRKTTGGGLIETGASKKEKKRRRRRTGAESGVRRRGRRDSKPKTPSGPVIDETRYTVVATVGEGAMGRIHLAKDKTLHRRVAYKSMSDDIAAQATLASKFTNEAQITAQLDHPNIVPVYSLENDRAYTMKLIKGETVEKILEVTKEQVQAGNVDELHTLSKRLDHFLRLCDAIDYAHDRGVIHRDLKPENIMVGEFNELYVMDWGIARVFTTDVGEPVELGKPSEEEGDLIIGTPGYMSPEQAEGNNEDLKGSSDQYSLGLILFEVVSLTPAVTGKAPLKIVMRHQDGEKNPLVHALGRKIPAELVAIVHKATAKDPAGRYASVRELGADVRRYLSGEAVRARPDRPLQALLRWMGKNREATLGVILFGIVSSLMGGVVILGYSAYALAQAESQKQRLGNLLTTVAKQSSLIDGQFLKYEGLLSVVGTSATDALTRTPDRDTYFLEAAYEGGAGAPPDLEMSDFYGVDISLQNASIILPAALDPYSVEQSIYQLGSLNRHFYKVMLRSKSEDAAGYTPNRAKRAIATVGVPVSWTYVGLEDGVYSVYPGHGGYPDDYDHREMPWYTLAKDKQGPTWGAPSPDVSGLGLVLSCAMALNDYSGNLLGVAGIDVTFDYLIEELLEAPEFKDKAGVETFLLDPKGRIVVRSSKKGKEVRSNAHRARTMRMPEFHHKEVVNQVVKKRSGSLKARGPHGRELVVYNRMHSIGWYYVVAGPEGTLMSAGIAD